MKLIWTYILAVFLATQMQANNTFDPFETLGTWDLTFMMKTGERPGWLEIDKSGNSTIVGRIMVIGGSARPISEITVQGEQMQFGIPVQWESGESLSFSFSYSDDKLSGTMKYSDGKTYSWSAVRAPELTRDHEPVWGAPIEIFDGHSLTGWKATGESNQWIVENGSLKSPKSGSNLMTADKFMDFKLHIEFRYPEHSNSGVYLRGRYEVQIEDNYGKKADSHYLGGVYGLLTPNTNAAKPAGEWQSYDITLVGRRISVIANGELIICEQNIPGITGGAIDSHEAEPGPIYLQGDHGPIEYRNIVLTPAK